MLNILQSSALPSPDGTECNDLPKWFRKISEHEFAHSKFFTYNPVSIEYRQVRVKSIDDLTVTNKEPYRTLNITMFWFFDGTGVALCSNYWLKKVEYFAFGCKHKYRELSQKECKEKNIPHYGNCYHVSECSECGHIFSVDSSD